MGKGCLHKCLLFFAIRNGQIDSPTIHEMYVGALGDSKYDSAELETVHTLGDKLVATLDPR